MSCCHNDGGTHNLCAASKPHPCHHTILNNEAIHPSIKANLHTQVHHSLTQLGKDLANLIGTQVGVTFGQNISVCSRSHKTSKYPSQITISASGINFSVRKCACTTLTEHNITVLVQGPMTPKIPNSIVPLFHSLAAL
jgi:hypothetical protein